jgi:hypothetical protein
MTTKPKTTHRRHKLSGVEHYNALGMSPRPVSQHQRVLGRMYRNLSSLVDYRDFGQIEVLTETELDMDTPNSFAPDVAAYRQGEPVAFWALEVERTQYLKKTKAKIARMMAQYPQLEEVFLYDYEQQNWQRFAPDTPDGEATDQSRFWGRGLARLLALTNRQLVDELSKKR